MTSALNVFGDEFVHHARTGRCSVTGTAVDVGGRRIGATPKRAETTRARVGAA